MWLALAYVGGVLTGMALWHLGRIVFQTLAETFRIIASWRVE